MLNYSKWVLISNLVVLLSILPLQSQIALPDILNDHMVLQRNIPIPVWGSAPIGKEIRVTIANRSVTTNSDAGGKWKVILPSMEAGGPYVINIDSENHSIEIQDVMIGEVWLCSGQSNMEWPLEQSASASAEIPAAAHPDIRVFLMKKKYPLDAKPFTREMMEEIDQGNFYQDPNWLICAPETAAKFSAVAYFFAKKLHNSLKVPIGLIQNAVGGSPIQSWVSRDGLSGHPQLEYLTNTDSGKTWHFQPGLHPWVSQRAMENLQPWLEFRDKAPLPRHPFGPGYLYDYGLKPLLPYPINGMIWYQGESDAVNPDLYPHLFHQFVSDIRMAWNNQQLPVIFVQLPKIGNRSRWPELRQAQVECLKIPNTAMVVSIDTGHPTDVHPKEKKVIGERLAAAALGKWYQKPVAYQGPTLAGWSKEENEIILKFDHVGEGLKLNGGNVLGNLLLDGYVNNGTRSLYIYPVKVVLSKNQVVMFIPEEFELTAIKYAWVPYPDEPLLYNSHNLPASPFKIELPGNN